MSCHIYTHKQGDTFRLQGTAKSMTGEVIDLTGYTIKSQARKSRVSAPLFNVSTDYSITIEDAEKGVFLIHIPDTTGWSKGRYFSDIEFKKKGDIKSTETFQLIITEDITHD